MTPIATTPSNSAAEQAVEEMATLKVEDKVHEEREEDDDEEDDDNEAEGDGGDNAAAGGEPLSWWSNPVDT
jgi:hypothetical protein